MTRILALLLALGGPAHALSVSATAYALRGTTASGPRAGPGQIALSRDLIARIPYGSTVRLVQVRGPHCGGYRTAPLRVTDTMARHVRNTADVWLPTVRQARSWGRCTARLEIVALAKGKR